MAIKGARPNERRVVPFLFVSDGPAAINFYRRAFDATELYRSQMPGGGGMFAQLRIFDSTIQLAEKSATQEEQGEQGISTPQSLGATTVVLEIYVDDVDAAFERATREGGKAIMPPHDAFYGDRYSWVADPFGHIWALSTVKETLTPQQVQQRMDEFMAQMGGEGCDQR